jgi:hypothetical protein
MTHAQEATRYAELRERAVSVARQPTIDDDEREEMIATRSAQALHWAGRDPAKARECATDVAVLKAGRNKAKGGH